MNLSITEIKNATQFAMMISRPIATALLFLISVTVTAQKPKLVVQTGHAANVVSVAFSPDGKTLASGGNDSTVKLWDVANGTELTTLRGHSGPVESVAFSPDGKILASGSSDKTVKLWDLATGTELRTIDGHSGEIRSVVFSPDGRTLVSGSADATVKLWDVSSGAELSTLKGHSAPVTSVAFGPNGKRLASGSNDGTIKLWDVETRSELRTVTAHSDIVYSVAFNPNGQTFASASVDSIQVWNASTGAELRIIRGHSSWISSLAFTPDGKMLASGSGDQTVKLWDLLTGTELRTLRGHVARVDSVAFSPDGKTLASGGDNIKLWDATTGVELRTLKGYIDGVNNVSFGPDGKSLNTARQDGTAKLWDVATGGELRTIKGQPSWVYALSPDRKTSATGGVDLKLWDVATEKELRTFYGHSDSVNSIAFNPNGTILASGSQDRTVKLWDVSTGTDLRTLRGHSGFVTTVAFSPDGKTLASGSWDNTVKLWDVSTGVELRTLKGHSQSVWTVAFSPDGKTLASSGEDGIIKEWDLLTGRELRALEGHSYGVTSVAFSPNSGYLVSGGEDGIVKVWEASSGKDLGSLIAFGDDDWLVVTPDGLFDGSPGAWSKIIWRFNNNTFDYAPLEAFFNEFYYPGLLADIFGGKSPQAPLDISQRDRRQPKVEITVRPPDIEEKVATPTSPKPPSVTDKDVEELWKIELAGALARRTIKVKVNVTDAVAGAQDVRLFRNGSLVKVWRGDVLKGQSSAALETTIPIVAGENRLTAYAFNHDNIKSSNATLVVTGAGGLKRKAVAYVVAVGVNEYANPQYNLKYAVADAQDFAEEFKRQQAKLNDYDKVEVIPLNDSEATKANILKSLADVAAKIQPEDALVIYFAGHGTAQQNRFYLIPHDLGFMGSRTQLDGAGLQSILAHSISDEEIEKAVEIIDAGQMLLVIDACNSGQALEAEEKRRGPMNSKGLAQLAYEKGMYILTAAQSYQAAQEAARLGHGYLTYALVEEGLKTNAADRAPKDGQVTLREWLDYATERVPQMQQEKLAEQQQKLREAQKQGRQLGLTLVDGDVQRPRVFYRRETEPHPLVVARP